MVEAIVPISGSAASTATQIGSSLSIAEPDNAWVASRQSHITAGLLDVQAEAGHGDGVRPHPHHDADEAHVDPDDRHPHKRHDREPSAELAADAEHPEDATLSGESERIGTMNFDEDTPFGARSAIL